MQCNRSFADFFRKVPQNTTARRGRADGRGHFHMQQSEKVSSLLAWFSNYNPTGVTKAALSMFVSVARVGGGPDNFLSLCFLLIMAQSVAMTHSEMKITRGISSQNKFEKAQWLDHSVFLTIPKASTVSPSCFRTPIRSRYHFPIESSS